MSDLVACSEGDVCRLHKLGVVDPSIRTHFHPEPGLTYLDTATYGLPPDSTMRVMREALDTWQAGTAGWVEWDRQSERARIAFARLIGAAPGRVALLPAVSVGATPGAEDVDVVVVVVVDSVPSDESSDSRLTASHTMSATSSAISAPKPTSAAGLRYQGVGGSGGWPGCC